MEHAMCRLSLFLIFSTLTVQNIYGRQSAPASDMRLCDQYDGTTAGDKIAACIRDLPNSGGIADARSLQGSQTISTDFLKGVTKPVRVLLAAGEFSTSTKITLPPNTTIEGVGDFATVIKPAVALPVIFDATNSTGVTIRNLKIDGAGLVGVGINLNNSTVGASTTNRIYETRIMNTKSYGISMDNNGDSVVEDCVLDVRSGVSVHWDDRGGNINLTRLSATEPGNRVQLAFQTAVLTDISVSGIEITFNSDQLRMVGGYIYSPPGGSAFKVDEGQWLTQLDGLGVRFEMLTAKDHAIDGKFVTGLFLTNPLFNDAFHVHPDAFGPNFGSQNAAHRAVMWLFGGRVDTSGPGPSWNPSGVNIVYENFVAGSGDVRNYRQFGEVGNDGAARLVVDTPSPTLPAMVERAVPGQIGDIQQWQDSNGKVLAKISANGGLQAGEGGAVLSKILVSTFAVDPPPLVNQGVYTTTWMVNGAEPGDVVLADHNQLPNGAAVLISAHATAGSVTVNILNQSGRTIDIAPGVLRVVLFKF